MAKRREQKDEEEPKEFQIPKFDKEKFINKEKEKIKATFIAFAFAVLIALISFGFWVLLQDNPIQWMLVLLFGIFSASWLRYLFSQLSIDTEKIERKGLFSSFAIYLFTWLFILIVLVNPPFYDAEPPQISVVSLPDIQEPGGTVKIVAKITDNAGVENNQARLILTSENETLLDEIFQIEDHIISYEFENDENRTGTISCEIIAEDISGLETKEQTSFQYSSDAIKLPSPSGATSPPGPTVTYVDELAIDVKADVDIVTYTIFTDDHSATINAKKPSQDDFYRTSPRVKGWIPNANINLTITATCIHYFQNDAREFNNTIIDTSTYYVVTSDAAEIGTQDPPSITPPQPNFIEVPGFELLVFILSIIGVLIALKITQSNQKNKP